MPIEIRELHITVAVNAAPPGTARPPQQAAGAGDKGAQGLDREALLAECVEQVLQVIHSRAER